MGVSNTGKVRGYRDKLHALLQQRGADQTAHVLDQLKSLPKAELFRLSHEAIAAELPDVALEFGNLDTEDEPTTLSGRTLRAFARDHHNHLASISVFDFARKFISNDLARAFAKSQRRSNQASTLISISFFEGEESVAAALERDSNALAAGSSQREFA